MLNYYHNKNTFGELRVFMVVLQLKMAVKSFSSVGITFHGLSESDYFEETQVYRYPCSILFLF